MSVRECVSITQNETTAYVLISLPSGIRIALKTFHVLCLFRCLFRTKTSVWVFFIPSDSPLSSPSHILRFSPRSCPAAPSATPGQERDVFNGVGVGVDGGNSHPHAIAPRLIAPRLIAPNPVVVRGPVHVHPHADHQIFPEFHHRERSIHGVLLFGRSGATYDHKSGLIRTGVLQLVRGAISRGSATSTPIPGDGPDRGLSTLLRLDL